MKSAEVDLKATTTKGTAFEAYKNQINSVPLVQMNFESTSTLFIEIFSTESQDSIDLT